MSRASAKYSIEAVDKTGAAMRSVKTKLSSLTQSFSAATAAAAGLATAGFAASAKSIVGLGDKIDKLSKSTGASAEFFSEINRTASLAGTSLDTVSRSLIRLQRATGEALSGNKTYAESFARLGVNLKSFAALSPDQQFTALAEAVARSKDQSLLMADGSQLMGRSFAELIPLLQGGADGLNKGRDAARGMGLTMSSQTAAGFAAVVDGFTNANAKMDAFVQTATVKLIPTLTQVADSLGDAVPASAFATKTAFSRVGDFIGRYAAAERVAFRDLDVTDFIFPTKGLLKLGKNFSLARATLKDGAAGLGNDFTSELDAAFSQKDKVLTGSFSAPAKTAAKTISQALTESVSAGISQGGDDGLKKLKALSSFIKRFVIPSFSQGSKDISGFGAQVSRSRFAFASPANPAQRDASRKLDDIKALLKSIDGNIARKELGIALE